MAEFALFAPRLLKWERGFSFDAADSGGATKDGVTLRTFAAYCRKKHWPEPGIDQLLALTALQWTEIMRDYWDRCRADQWRDQCLADFVVDWYVNAGGPAIRALQWAAHVQADGIVGSKTLRAVNKAPSVKLLQTLLVARKAFYINLVRRRPDQRRFLRGWLNRTEDMAREPRKEEA